MTKQNKGETGLRYAPIEIGSRWGTYFTWGVMCASGAESSTQSGKKKAERKGLFTSGIVSTREGRRIALFFSGRKHAGENLKDVLSRRAADLGVPIQMCDALCAPDVSGCTPKGGIQSTLLAMS